MFTRKEFLDKKRWLYHFSPKENLANLRAEKAMYSTAEWVRRANSFRIQLPNPDVFLSSQRLQSITLEIGEGRTVTLNDQIPLQRGQCNNLQGTYEDFLRCLNGYIFFWPGDENRPKPVGKLAKSFAKKYAHFGVIRIPSKVFWPENDDNPKIRFCRYNSGAPQARAKAPRGPQIFVTSAAADFNVTGIAEVVFSDRIDLPPSSQWKAPGEKSPWESLFKDEN